MTNILRKCYGDYEKFIVDTSCHGYVKFDTNRPYVYYTKRGENA